MNRLLITLLLICLVATAHRVHLTMELPHFDSEDGTGFYWVENALQYRYAEMVANGVPIPEHDSFLQVPEGVAPFRDFTIGMEPAAGWLYRLLGLTTPFHFFAIVFIAGVSSLAVFPVGLLAVRFWRSYAAGVVAALFYAFAFPAFDRNVGTFLLESFTLPWLFTGTALLLFALDESEDGRRGVWAGGAAGVCLGIGLACWHLSRFYLAQLFLSVFLLILWRGGRGRGDVRLFAACLAPLLVTALAVPVLRVNEALLSPGILLGAGVIGLCVLKGTVSLRQRLAVGFLLLAFLALVWMLSGGEGSFSHVYQTVAAMFAAGGGKPADPAMLTMPVRLLWVGAFTPPSAELLVTTVLFLSLPLILACASLFRPLRRGSFSRGQLTFLVLTGIALVEYLLMRRLGVLAIFFLAILAGGAAVDVFRAEGVGRRWLWGVCLALAVVGHLHMAWTWQQGNPIRKALSGWFAKTAAEQPVAANWHNYNVEMLNWIRTSTRQDAVFLAPMGVSGAIIAYTGRPVAVHSKFETWAIRDKYQRFVTALYATEEELYRFCRENNVDYLLYEPGLVVDRDPDSYRYIADRLRLTVTMPAVSLHFFPERLRHFELVFQNPNGRVFQVVDVPLASRRLLPPQPLFDPARYAITYDRLDRLDDYAPAVSREQRRAVASFGEALRLAEGGRLAEAHFLAETINREWPNLPHLNGFLCQLRAARGDFPGALVACRDEVAVTPFDPESHLLLSEIYLQNGDAGKAREERQLADELQGGLHGQ